MASRINPIGGAPIQYVQRPPQRQNTQNNQNTAQSNNNGTAPLGEGVKTGDQINFTSVPGTTGNTNVSKTGATNNTPRSNPVPVAEAPKPTDIAELNKPSNPQSPIAPQNTIRNPQVAYESANAVMAQITAQPGVAMLAQANANPAAVVNLMK
jgi:hypothetical protein